MDVDAKAEIQRSARILIADDSQTNRRLLEAILTRQGYQPLLRQTENRRS
jgi:PleD family two-component response regulator